MATYKGTKMWGTSTSAKEFPKSGIAKASAGQTYLNTSTGNVYKCVRGGKPQDATWKYDRTDIIKRPSSTPTSVQLSRNGDGARSMKATWKVPDALKNQKSPSRATGLVFQWLIYTSWNPKPWVVEKEVGLGWTSCQLNLNEIPVKVEYTETIDGKTVKKTRWATRQDFYPSRGRKLTKIGFQICAKNGKGKGKFVPVSRDFKIPRAPAMTAPVHNEETGVVSVDVTTNPGHDYLERYDAELEVLMFDSRDAAKGDVSVKKVYPTTSNAYNLFFDAADRFKLVPGEYLRFTFRARARGYAGDSAWVSKTHVVGYPTKPSITGVSVNSTKADGKVIVGVSIDTAAGTKPVDRVRLEALVSTDAESAEEAIAKREAWVPTGAMDNGSCTALVADVGELIPDSHKKTWIRVKAWHDIDDLFYLYSAPVRVRDLEDILPTGEDDECEIVSIRPAATDDTATVTVGWGKRDSATPDDATGTELSWSDSPDAWRSTDPPETFEFANDWGEEASDGEWLYQATVHIKGLSGGPLYVKARRFMDRDELRTWGSYSPIAYIVPAALPASVALNAPKAVPQGSPAQFSWAYSSSTAQSAWLLETSEGVVLAEGEDPYGQHSVPWQRIEALAAESTVTADAADENGIITLDPPPATGSAIRVSLGTVSFEHAFKAGEAGEAEADLPDGICSISYDGNDSVTVELPEGASRDDFAAIIVYRPDAETRSFTVRVSVSMGGEWVSSDYSTVWISDPPSLALSDVGTLSEQPLVVGLSSDDSAARAVVRVSADGGGGSSPGGTFIQASGDTIWSASLLPDWTEGGELGYKAEVELPSELEFKDGCSYSVEVTLVDDETGLSSQTMSQGFSVAWEHQAAIPPDSIEVEANAVYDEDGGITRLATIRLEPPVDAGEDDVYDVYRLTGDGPSLIATSLPLDYELVDEHAPFSTGQCSYRVALRTPDGDVEWKDFPYVLDCAYLRFDFGGMFLECPYNISVKDSYEKDFAAAVHLDGTVEGSWNEGARRRSSLSTDLIRFEEASQISLVKALASHAGPVFVRTPDGDAYAANVVVSGIDLAYTTDAVAVSLDAEEVGLTAEFTPPSYTPEEPVFQEGGE